MMNKAERINQELLYLADKNSFHLQDIMDEFNISRKTAWRDLKELENLGLAYYSIQGRGGGYKIINKHVLTKIYFNNGEINAIFFALKALNQMSTTPFSSEYKRIYRKLLKSLSNNNRQEVILQQKRVNYRQQPSLHRVEYFDLLMTAVTQNLVLMIKNSQYVKGKQKVQIYEIFYQTGNWFCYVYNLDLQKFFILRCDKITFCQKVGPAKLSYAELTKKLQRFNEKYYDFDFKCEITKRGKDRFLLDSYPKMKVKIEENKYYLLGKINHTELDYLAEYLVQLGPNISNIQPKKLRQKYNTTLKKMIKNNEQS